MRAVVVPPPSRSATLSDRIYVSPHDVAFFGRASAPVYASVAGVVFRVDRCADVADGAAAMNNFQRRTAAVGRAALVSLVPADPPAVDRIKFEVAARRGAARLAVPGELICGAVRGLLEHPFNRGQIFPVEVRVAGVAHVLALRVLRLAHRAAVLAPGAEIELVVSGASPGLSLL